MKLVAATLLAVTGLVASATASAHTDVSLGISLGGGYYEPAPRVVYGPTYYEPAPVYYAPPQVVYEQRYYAPRPVYYGSYYSGPRYNVVYRDGRRWCNDHNDWHGHDNWRGHDRDNGWHGNGNWHGNDRDNGWRYKNR